MENANVDSLTTSQKENGMLNIAHNVSTSDLVWSPKMFRKSDVIRFRYLQPLDGDTNVRYGKILTWREISPAQIAQLNWVSSYRAYERYKGSFKRCGYLLTIEHLDGTIKNYWTKRVPVPRKCSRIIFAIRKALTVLR